MVPIMPAADLSERDNKETLFVKEEVTNDTEVFGEVEVGVSVFHSAFCTFHSV